MRTKAERERGFELIIVLHIQFSAIKKLIDQFQTDRSKPTSTRIYLKMHDYFMTMSWLNKSNASRKRAYTHTHMNR